MKRWIAAAALLLAMPPVLALDGETGLHDPSTVIQEGGSMACYSPAQDVIRMPDRARFNGTATMRAGEAYYATLMHELTHWTGAESRCDRNMKSRFGSEAYAMEELVAELGAAFLCAGLGVTAELREDHAQYIAHWLKVLKADKKAIFAAAAHAQRAADYLGRFSRAVETAA